MRILQARIVPCPPAGDLLEPGIEPKSPAFQADSLPSELLDALNKRKFIKSQSNESGKGEGGSDQRVGGHAMCQLPCSPLF